MFDPISVSDIDNLPETVAARLTSADYGIDPGVDAAVAEIVATVRSGGDAALIELTERFDGVQLTSVFVSADAISESAARAPAELRAAVDQMIVNVRRFHAEQRGAGYTIQAEGGTELSLLRRPLRSVGVYVPGGLAAYPTTVVMNVVPAQIAGVGRIVALTPPKSVPQNPAVAYALRALGVTDVIGVGGAQAVAAAAYGTETIEPVDKIVGPGNAYVAAAKRQVFGKVGIDSIAGPSEVVIVADESAPADWLAWDLMAQAEHDESARSILITTSDELARAVATAVEAQTARTPRAEVIRAALRDHGLNCVVRDLDAAVTLANRSAPEHLQVIVSEEAGLAPTDFVAGAIFWGAHAPTAVGDYWAGPNHVLPTGGTARYRGPLSVDDFTVQYSVVGYGVEAARRLAPAVTLAESEGLFAHAEALRARTK